MKSFATSPVDVFMLLFFCAPAPFPVDDQCQLSALHSSTAFPSSDLWENVLWPVIDSALPAPLLSIAVKVPVICRKPVSTALSTLSFPLSATRTTCSTITVASSLTRICLWFSILLCLNHNGQIQSPRLPPAYTVKYISYYFNISLEKNCSFTFGFTLFEYQLKQPYYYH